MTTAEKRFIEQIAAKKNITSSAYEIIEDQKELEAIYETFIGRQGFELPEAEAKVWFADGSEAWYTFNKDTWSYAGSK